MMKSSAEFKLCIDQDHLELQTIMIFWQTLALTLGLQLRNLGKTGDGKHNYRVATLVPEGNGVSVMKHIHCPIDRSDPAECPAVMTAVMAVKMQAKLRILHIRDVCHRTR